jgi:HPt (histidine-containing phosphotransfer) domain-containing protein
LRLRQTAHRSTVHDRESQPRAWHLLLAAPVLLCVLLMTGCSSNFVYNRLDTLASWYLESLVSLNDGQRGEMRAWLARTLAWHRRSELTRYVSFLNDVSASVAQPGTQRSYDAMRERFQALIDDLMRQAAPEASRQLLRLSPEQVDELLASLAEKTRESTEENTQAVAENEWKPDQTKSISRQMKRWTGSVSAEQKRIIAKHVETLEPTFSDWAESQQSWRAALRAALLAENEGEPSNTPPPRVLALLADPDRQWTRAYTEKAERNRDRYQQMLMDLDATLSAQQRDHLRTELNKLSQQFSRLAQS